MGQIFHPSSNTIAKVSILGGILILGIVVWSLAKFNRSPYITQVGVAREQPVPFSHKHHVQGLGIDCRYCHTSVEESSFAGIPPVSTCMNCHSVVWKDAEILEPIRESFRTGEPVEWVRVHDLPDFVYFDHSIHVNKGVSCTTCHGNVDEMPLMWRENTLHMEWCLSCHREPEKFIGPQEAVFDPAWKMPKTATEEKHGFMMKDGEFNTSQMTNCTVCHR